MTKQLWWLIHKDLIVEQRTRQAWPSMLLLGIMVAAVFSLQVDLPPEQRPAIVGGLLWLATLLAGQIVIERTSAAEQQDGCWEGLVLYPVAPAVVYLAKLTVNFVALMVLALLMVSLFAVVADVPLWRHPGAITVVALLGSLGMAAAGTLVSTLSQGLRQHGALLSLLLTPLAVPVVLAAAEATRLIAEDHVGPAWWRWVQLLAAFVVVFTTAGVTLFGFLVED